jgi:exonuclease III
MIPIAHGHTFLFSGRKDGKHRQGVGFVLSKKARTALKSFTPVNSRIITARFAASHGFCTVVQVYAPTNDSQEAQKNAFYEQLQSTLDNIPRQDVLVLMADFNAKVGSDHKHWQGVLGKHSIGGVSDNGLRLLEFCALNGLVITNSFFRHKAIHKYTWYSNTGRTRNAIDHIIVRSKSLSSVQDTRVYRGADISSDHRLVACSLKLKFKRARPKGNIEPRFNTDLLDDASVLDHFQSVVGGRYHALLNEMEVDTDDPVEAVMQSEWSRFSKEVAASAMEVLGEQKSYRSWPWVTKSTEQLVEEKRKAFILSVNSPSPEFLE